MPWQQPWPAGSFSGLTQCFLGLKEFAENSEFCKFCEIGLQSPTGRVSLPPSPYFLPHSGPALLPGSQDRGQQCALSPLPILVGLGTSPCTKPGHRTIFPPSGYALRHHPPLLISNQIKPTTRFSRSTPRLLSKAFSNFSSMNRCSSFEHN